MPLTDYSLDKFVAPHLSELSRVGAPDLRDCSSQYGAWVNNFILNALLRVRLQDRYRQLSLQFLRKTDGSFQEYHEARDYLASYLAEPGRAVSSYFHALRHFESAVSLAYQAYDALHFMVEERLFEKRDGSALQRLNRLQNISKHASQELTRGDIPENLSVPIWVTDAAIECHDGSLTWLEYSELMVELAKCAELVSNPPVPKVDANPA